MKIDLRKEGRLTVDQSRKINEIEPQVRYEFDQYIGKLASENSLNGIDWFLETTCRNTFASDLHNRFCQIALISELIESGEGIDEILLDDKCMKSAVSGFLENNDLKTKITQQGRSSRIIKSIKNFCKSFYLILNHIIWPKVIRRNQRPIGEIVFLENFLFIDSFDERNRLIDRNYPGFFEYYDQKKRGEVWYLSVINGLKHPGQWISLLRAISKSDEQIVIMEDYLYLKDYLDAFLASFLLPMKIKNIPKWRGIDVSEIVFDEARREIGGYSLIINILYFKSFARIKEAGINPKLIIDWHENQTIDRALNLGMSKNFPQALRKGYQGFLVSDFYSSLTPTVYERDNNLLPNEIFVISEKLIKRRKKYSNEFVIRLAPAFRYQRAMNFSNLNKNYPKDILVALPMLFSEANQLLELVLDSQMSKETKIIVKKHPTITKHELLANVVLAKDERLNFTDDDLTDLFHESILFVTMTSSAAIEAVSCQTYVAIIANRNNATANPLEHIVEPNYWRLCYTPNCIDLAYKHAKVNSVSNKTNYLVPLSERTFAEFIN